MRLESADIVGIVEEELAAELCNVALSGLARRDQRAAGLDYVLGLLATQGRKTVRGIASCERTQSAYEQRLHHFVSRSTWSARDVRARLVEYLHTQDHPRSWVIRPMVVPKYGQESVGVKNEVVPCMGRALNHQHVFSTWFMGRLISVPVDWRVVVPETWSADPGRRDRTGIPRSVDSPTSSHAAAALVKAVRAEKADSPAPVVMDARETDAALVMRAAQAKRLPYLLRIPGSARLAVPGARPTDPARIVGAQRLAMSIRPQRRPIPGQESRAASRAAVAVTTHDEALETTLLCVWSSRAGAAETWLTDLPLDAARVVDLTGLLAAADTAFSQTAEPLGAVDYEGRSYNGWHHHMTMVSIAHATRLLARAEAAQLAPVTVLSD